MNFAIIKQYGLGSLINIAFFKVIYKLKLNYFRKHIPQSWSKKEGNVVEALSFEPFFSRCCNQVDYIQKEADIILDGKITLFGESFSIDPIHGWLNDPVSGGRWNKDVYFVEAPTKQEGLADVKYVLELNKFNHLVRVALAYYHTNDNKYTHFITDSIVGYRETVKPFRSVVQRIIMDMGFRVINLIQILLLCKNNKQFQQETASLINGIIFNQVKAIEEFHTAKWFKTGNGANHITGELVGLILGQLWLQNNGLSNFDRKFKKEYSYLVEVLKRTIAKSGAYLEQSGNYSRLVAEFLVMFDLLKGCMGHKDYCKAYEDGHYKERLLQYLRDISYADYVPNFGDNDDARVLTAFCSQGELVEYFIKDVRPSNQPEAYLDGSQWVFCSHDKYDIHLFARVGKYAYFHEGASIHAHNDLLAVIIGVGGQPVFVDKGMRFYNSGVDLQKTYSQIAAHNTISFEGKEMNKLEGGACYNYPQCDFVKGDIRDAVVFSGVLKYGDVEQKRIIAYQDGVIEIDDYLSLNDETNAKGAINYLLDQHIKVEQEGTNILLSLKDGGSVRVTIQGVESIELCLSDYSPAYGQNVNTTLIRGAFSASKEKRIKTIILI